MARRTFTLEELARYDGGKLAAAFNHNVAKLAADCDDRPGLKAPRKLTLEIEMKPAVDPETSHFDGVDVEYFLKPTIPKFSSKKKQRLACKLTTEGAQLSFDDQTRDARQPALDDVGGEKTRDD